MAPEDVRKLTDEELRQRIERLASLKAWGSEWFVLQEEQASRYRREMTELIGSPAANRFYH